VRNICDVGASWLMTRSLKRIDERAVALCRDIVEAPGCRISSAVLFDYHREAGQNLIETGVLTADDHDPVAVSAVDHDDEPVSLTWSPEHGGYGYFSPSAGWVAVPAEKLQQFHVDMGALIARLVDRLDLPSTARPTERISDVLWEIGDARLPGRNGRVPTWFARRLGDADVWRQVVAYLAGRPPSDFRVVITTSAAAQLQRDELSRHDIIEIRDVDDHGFGLVVEPSYLAAQLTSGASSSEEDPVRHASGFRHVWVGDREFRFNGDKHRQIVEYLFNAWARGEPSVSSAAMFADLEFETTSRLRDIFKGHKDWKALIEAKGGACRLRVEELLEEQRANAD